MAPFNQAQVAAGVPTQLNKTTPIEQAGYVLHQTKGLLKCIFNVLAQTGGTAPAGSYNLVDDLGNPATLPQGAVVTNVVCYVKTAFVGTSGTVALTSTLVAADLMAATAIASLSLGAVVAGKPVGTAATWVGPITAVAGSTVQAVVATTTQTAGYAEYFLEFVITN